MSPLRGILGGNRNVGRLIFRPPAPWGRGDLCCSASWSPGRLRRIGATRSSSSAHEFRRIEWDRSAGHTEASGEGRIRLVGAHENGLYYVRALLERIPNGPNAGKVGSIDLVRTRTEHINRPDDELSLLMVAMLHHPALYVRSTNSGP